jgi:hypothetical protein
MIYDMIRNYDIICTVRPRGYSTVLVLKKKKVKVTPTLEKQELMYMYECTCGELYTSSYTRASPPSAPAVGEFTPSDSVVRSYGVKQQHTIR